MGGRILQGQCRWKGRLRAPGASQLPLVSSAGAELLSGSRALQKYWIRWKLLLFDMFPFPDNFKRLTASCVIIKVLRYDLLLVK